MIQLSNYWAIIKTKNFFSEAKQLSNFLRIKLFKLKTFLVSQSLYSKFLNWIYDVHIWSKQWKLRFSEMVGSSVSLGNESYSLWSPEFSFFICAMGRPGSQKTSKSIREKEILKITHNIKRNSSLTSSRVLLNLN